MAPPIVEPLLHFATRDAFAAWLAEHGSTSTRLWLRFYKKHTRRAQMTYEEAVEEGLCAGWIDSLVKRLDDDSYAQLFSPRRATSRWSESNLARIRKLVAAGRLTAADLRRLGVPRENDAARTVEPHASALDPSLRVLLEASTRACSTFDGLPPSHQRRYVAWIMSAKKPETRERRLREAVALLERGDRLPMK